MKDILLYILAITGWMFLICWLCKGSFFHYASKVLSKSGRRRLRKPASSFRDWFFCKKYRGIIPKSFFVWYYGNYVTYLVVLIIGVITIPLGYDQIWRGALRVYHLGYSIYSFYEMGALGVERRRR